MHCRSTREGATGRSARTRRVRGRTKQTEMNAFPSRPFLEVLASIGESSSPLVFLFFFLRSSILYLCKTSRHNYPKIPMRYRFSAESSLQLSSLMKETVPLALWRRPPSLLLQSQY